MVAIRGNVAIHNDNTVHNDSITVHNNGITVHSITVHNNKGVHRKSSTFSYLCMHNSITGYSASGVPQGSTICQQVASRLRVQTALVYHGGAAGGSTITESVL